MTANERLQEAARKFAKERFGGKPDEGDYNLILSAMCIGAELALSYMKTEVLDDMKPPIPWNITKQTSGE
jgi:hypothetical protein